MANMDNQNSQSRQQSASANPRQGTEKRGFAAMDPQRQREIASAGGRAAHVAGTAHEFTSEEARAAGRHSHMNDNRASARSGSQQAAPSRQSPKRNV